MHVTFSIKRSTEGDTITHNTCFIMLQIHENSGYKCLVFDIKNSALPLFLKLFFLLMLKYIYIKNIKYI